MAVGRFVGWVERLGEPGHRDAVYMRGAVLLVLLLVHMAGPPLSTTARATVHHCPPPPRGSAGTHRDGKLPHQPRHSAQLSLPPAWTCPPHPRPRPHTHAHAPTPTPCPHTPRLARQAVALVLGFIGAKMVLGFADVNIPTDVSLLVVGLVLGGGVGVSLLLPESKTED